MVLISGRAICMCIPAVAPPAAEPGPDLGKARKKGCTERAKSTAAKANGATKPGKGAAKRKLSKLSNPKKV